MNTVNCSPHNPTFSHCLLFESLNRYKYKTLQKIPNCLLFKHLQTLVVNAIPHFAVLIVSHFSNCLLSKNNSYWLFFTCPQQVTYLFGLPSTGYCLFGLPSTGNLPFWPALNRLLNFLACPQQVTDLFGLPSTGYWPFWPALNRLLTFSACLFLSLLVTFFSMVSVRGAPLFLPWRVTVTQPSSSGTPSCSKASLFSLSCSSSYAVMYLSISSCSLCGLQAFCWYSACHSVNQDESTDQFLSVFYSQFRIKKIGPFPSLQKVPIPSGQTYGYIFSQSTCIWWEKLTPNFKIIH